VNEAQYKKLLSDLRALETKVREMEQQMRKLKSALRAEQALHVDYEKL
jgi:hypothetical protein